MEDWICFFNCLLLFDWSLYLLPRFYALRRLAMPPSIAQAGHASIHSSVPWGRGRSITLFLQSQSISPNLGRTLPSFPPHLEDPTTLTFSEERCQNASLLFFKCLHSSPFYKRKGKKAWNIYDPLVKLALKPVRRAPWRMGSTEQHGYGGRWWLEVFSWYSNEFASI